MKINREAYFKKITGYKISNSHFELGSNLHISDYYYAKRLFYNSFYTNRFAFLITRYILEKFSDLINNANTSSLTDSKEHTITLIGFENYSELLVSNVRKMLNDYIKAYIPGPVCFNHDIYTKENVFLKNPDNIGNNIILIFPISTTFSTSVKIQNEIREILAKNVYRNKDIVFHTPIINCLVITNGNLDRSDVFDTTDIEWEFGWEHIDQKRRIIQMRNIDNQSDKIQQQFFINLSTVWQKINECTSCYPIVKANEKSLFETKVDPVTPSLIFGYPKAIWRDQKENIYELFKEDLHAGPIVYRKHFVKHNNNYIYYIRAGVFLKKNREAIEHWLRSKRLDFKHLNDRNIVIVTPSTGSNSGFVNMVNDLLFSETATIIQYNPSDDYLYNFKTFYSGILELADYILFVDDLLFTTGTFSEINFYIKNIKRKKNLKGIDLCLTLINRSGYYNNRKLDEQLKGSNKLNVQSFVNVNVAPILHRKTFPYIKLTEKFKDLSSKSVLDEMRIHFKTKERDFIPLDLAHRSQKLNKFGTTKEIFQFVVQNEFNKIFQFDGDKNRYVDELLIHSIFEGSEKHAMHTLISHIDNSDAVSSFLNDYPDYRCELKNCLYKICSSEPFIQFKNLRQTVFSWVLNDLKKMVEKILSTESIGIDFFEAIQGGRPSRYSTYQEFKFLLKRGTKLKMNYIYSIEVLDAIEKVINGIKTHKTIQYYKYVIDMSANQTLFDDKLSGGNISTTQKAASKDIYTHEFITYYIGLLQELIVDHESKALQTVINVKEIIDRNIALEKINLKNSYDGGYINLLRMLVLENTFIFHSSSEKFLKKSKLKVSLDDLNDPSTLVDFRKQMIEYAVTYTFNYTDKMLSRIYKFENKGIEFKKDSPMYASFENMLLLKSALLTDKLDKGQSGTTINQKIETILKYCCSILDIQNGGAFFAVKYKNKNEELTAEDDIAIVGEYYGNTEKYLKTSDINANSVLNRVFTGIKEKNSKKSLSSFEISLGTDNKYNYLENQSISADEIEDMFELESKNFGNYYYLRITEITRKNRTFIAIPIAVLCFYDTINIPEGSKFTRFDPKRVRQLLLLRNNINNFINDQLNNDSLRAYIEQQNQTIINKAITHSFDTYVQQYQKAVKELEGNILQNKFEILGTLILNKHLLLKFIADYLKDKDVNRTIRNLRLNKLEIKCPDFKLLVKDYCNLIFSISLTNHSIIESSQVKLSIELDDNETLLLYEFFYRELIFEVFYNLRKLYNPYVDDEYLLEILIGKKIKKGITYLTITNNLYDHLPKEKKTRLQLENSMHNRKEKKGISLINTISEILYDKKCQLEITNNTFEIQIPIETT